MPSKDQDGLAEIGEGRMFSEERSRVYTDLMIGKEPLVGAERWERHYATGGVAPPLPPPPPRRTIREGFSPLQAIANLVRTSKRWLTSGRALNRHELDAASLARNREEAMAVIRDATGRVEVTDQENERREVLLDNLRSTPFQFDESVPSSPHQRPSQEGSLHLQALANFEPMHTAMREAANIGMSTDEVANAVSILADLADPTPRPTIRMIRFRKE